MEVSRFNEKLNKVDGNVYVIEEKVFLTDGVYIGELKHDNINQTTLAVYTGPRLTGERIQTFALSTPSLTPWKRGIKVFASVEEVYITYETDGDTVEAEDVNRLQEAMSKTQTAVNTEYERATKAEEAQREELDAEIRRAQDVEAELAEQVSEERVRAEDAERVLENGLQAESERALKAEKILTGNLDNEISRSQAAEKVLADNLASEAVRAQTAEQKVTESLDAEIIRAKEAETGLKNTIDTNKPKWDDKYTKNEVDNKFSTLETAIDWKESVTAFADLARTYPSPQDGWTVNIKDTDYTYRYSGSTWVAISANSIPKATKSVDGLLAKEDKIKFDEAYSKQHEHGNKTIIDTITQILLNNWNAAYTHVTDMIKHISAAERTSWNDADTKKHTHENKIVIDAIGQTQINAWNAVTNKVDKVTGKQLSTNDYTAAEKTKLAGVAAGAEVNVQPDWNVTDKDSDAFVKNKPSTFIPSVHTHAKAEVGLENAENKNGAAIRGEMTREEVVKALGYTPPTSSVSYTHPDSGAKAGTYKSVAINAQGHVTGGTNPTTLEGYGITDAMPKGPFTWTQMRGDYTWNQLKGV